VVGKNAAMAATTMQSLAIARIIAIMESPCVVSCGHTQTV
jgi:hypothetical protein